MMILRVLLVFFLVLSSTTRAQESIKDLLDRHNSHSIPYFSANELDFIKDLPNLVIIDAREPGEYAVSHIKNAINIDLKSFNQNDPRLNSLRKDANIVVYCSVGIRSETLGEKLKQAGFTNVKNLFGGIFEWKNNGYRIIDNDGKETEKVHVYSRKWKRWLHKGHAIY